MERALTFSKFNPPNTDTPLIRTLSVPPPVSVLTAFDYTLFLYIVSSFQNGEKKSLRHVAMVAKFLDDNKPKHHLKSGFRTVSNFIDLV